jgi:hypothetical protein
VKVVRIFRGNFVNVKDHYSFGSKFFTSSCVNIVCLFLLFKRNKLRTQNQHLFLSLLASSSVFRSSFK